MVGIAFENYVLAMTIDAKKIQLQVRTYDRLNQHEHTYAALELKSAYRFEGTDEAESSEEF
jgi:hypothetical protein